MHKQKRHESDIDIIFLILRYLVDWTRDVLISENAIARRTVFRWEIIGGQARGYGGTRTGDKERDSKLRGSRMRSRSRANHLVASERPSVSVVATLRVHDVIVFFEKCVGFSRTHAPGFSREPAAITEWSSPVPGIADGVRNNGPVVE